MILKEEIEALRVRQHKTLPQVVMSIIDRANEKLIRSGIAGHALGEGDKAPDFALPNTAGQEVGLTGLLSLGPLVLFFYRGEWCDFCKLELRALQESLPQITSLGASAVAISPQTTEHTRSTIEKINLTYQVLSDRGNRIARRFGLVFRLPKELRPVYESLGIDLPGYNGDRTFELPMPAIYLIDTDRTIIKAHVDPDYTNQMDPAEIVSALHERNARQAGRGKK